MIKTALIGHPLGHSLSGVIHNAAFKALGLDGKYELLDVKPEKLSETIDFLKKEGYSGFNVTIPYKVEVAKYLHLQDYLVEYAGCTNCVRINAKGEMFGYNTDIYGFTTAIPENIRKNLEGKKALIIGNGGAARAVAAALVMMKLSVIDFKVRSLEKASAVSDFMKMKFKNTTCSFAENLEKISDYAIIVNATPLGTTGENANKMPIASSLLEQADKSAVIYDLVYNPAETKYIKTAKEMGLYTIGGLDMLVYQAQKAFKIFTTKEPDFNVMKEAALKYL
ncbi:MAG: shikimate dehydrogenase [Candidatus Gastranaerophilales bacterium]|nr:shikimate dehydrogenase [Candidatus Gastranaerophilales bacterium]